MKWIIIIILFFLEQNNYLYLKKYINDVNKIVIGISAGAINMAEKVVLAKDVEDNIPNLSIYKGKIKWKIIILLRKIKIF